MDKKYLFPDSLVLGDNGKNLYHFTSAESFFSIFNDLTLKFSSFKKLNDLNEANLCNFEFRSKDKILRDKLKRYIDDKCGIICFSQDYNEKGFSISGVNHPALWAHYANNTNGVCIVIDKDMFIKKNENILAKCFWRFESVDYEFVTAPNIDYNGEINSEFIENFYKTLFFIKHKNWQNEHEYRLFVMDCDEKMSINGCVKQVVLGNKFSNNEFWMRKLVDKIADPQDICFKKFELHNFAVAVSYPGGYMADTTLGVHRISTIIEKSIYNYKNFLNLNR